MPLISISNNFIFSRDHFEHPLKKATLKRQFENILSTAACIEISKIGKINRSEAFWVQYQ